MCLDVEAICGDKHIPVPNSALSLVMPEHRRRVGRGTARTLIRRYHEGIGIVTPADSYHVRREEVAQRRKEVSGRTLQQRSGYLRAAASQEADRGVP